MHIDADALMEAAADHPHLSLVERSRENRTSTSSGGRYRVEKMPKFKIPQEGCSESEAYNIINHELTLDGTPTLNLASFVHVNVPEHCHRLLSERANINLVDQDEYPATMAIHGRCVSMLADLWHAPIEKDAEGKRKAAFGVATTGSSEALMLGGLAMKKRWQNKRKAEGKSMYEPGPNLVFGANCQVCIEKLCRYFDIEAREVPVSKESHYCLDVKKAVEMCDENTIGVFNILGSTYTGHYEPAQELNDALDDLQKRTGLDIPIHIDGASGGFVAPFAQPNLKWDFQLPRVVSINTSGHKYGMVLAGLGWVVFRNTEYVPSELVFELHYLGSVEYSFGLNFSRPAAPVLAQYYNFLNLGFDGYQRIMQEDLKNARLLSRALELSGLYEVLSDIHRPASRTAAVGQSVGITDEFDAENYVAGLPVVSFKWSDKVTQTAPSLKGQQRLMQTLLRVKGWIVPNYGLPKNLETVDILRVVVREDMSEDMVDQLVHDILSITEDLMQEGTPASKLAAIQGHGHGTDASLIRKHHAHKHQHLRKQATRPHMENAQEGNKGSQC
jgi:glutamate decarboxylase